MLLKCFYDYFHTAVFDAYKKLSGSDIEDSIKSETSGNLENLLGAVGKNHNLCWWHCSHHTWLQGARLPLSDSPSHLAVKINFNTILA